MCPNATLYCQSYDLHFHCAFLEPLFVVMLECMVFSFYCQVGLYTLFLLFLLVVHGLSDLKCIMIRIGCFFPGGGRMVFVGNTMLSCKTKRANSVVEFICWLILTSVVEY
jgi:hypothetical protein